MVRRTAKVTALAVALWVAAVSSGDLWRLMGWNGLTPTEQRTVAWFQGGAVGVCVGVWIAVAWVAMFGGLRLRRAKGKGKGKGQRR